jgi:hypothetical protein
MAVALLVYDFRHRAHVRPVILRWRERIELRAVLYCFAVIQLLGVPIGILKATVALNAQSASRRENFFSLFPWMCLFAAGIAIAVIVYDRRRLAREAEEDGHCRRCGYDLRATPDRCPECGTIATDRDDATSKTSEPT